MKPKFNLRLRFLLNFALLAMVIRPVLAQTWVQDFPLKTARWNHTATLLTNGLVLIAGGQIFNDSTNGFFVGTNGVELYNPVTGASVVTAPMSSAHQTGSAVLLTNGQALVIGGRNDNGSVISSSELYNSTNANWTSTGSLHTERAGFPAVVLPNGKVLVVGGFNNSAVDVASVELYDPASGNWTNVASLSYATDSATATVLTNGLVLVTGGSAPDGGAITNASLYNPAGNSWTLTGPMSTPRAGHAATLLADGRVLVVGGDNSAEIYNPATGRFTTVAPMNDGRSTPTAALLPNGQVLVVGGDPGQTDTELYNPASNTWTLAASLKVGRVFNTMTALGDGEVVVAGGDAGTIGYFNGPAIASVETYAGHLVPMNHTLAAHYPFDAPSGSDPFDGQLLMDTSGNGYNISNPSSGDGTYPMVTTNNIAGGSAIQFDGNNYYELPTNLLSTIAGSFSISLWLDTVQVSGNDTDDGFDDPAFVWAGGVGDNTFDSEPMTLTGSKLGFYTGGSEVTLHSVTSINSGSFTHIVVTRDQPTGVKKIYINGVLDATGAGSTNFLSDSTDLLLGESFYTGGVAGTIDDVQFYSGVLTDGDVAFLFANPGQTAAPAAAAPTLEFALNVTNLAFTTTGDAPWFGETEVSHDGIAAAQSGSLSDDEFSTLQTTVTGPGTLTFWWQTVGTNDNFNLEFDVDGNETADIPGQDLWVQETIQITAGTHTLTWTASSGEGSSPADAGYVDQVVYTSQAPPPSPGMWTLTGSMSTVRSGHSATLLTNGLVLVEGGGDNNENLFATAELYNPATGTWSGTGAMTNAREDFTATLLPNGKVLVAGGTVNFASYLNSAELYDPATGTWKATGAMHDQRCEHTAVLLPNGKVLVAGGINGGTFPDNILRGSEIYDPATELWTTNGPMTTGRYSHAMTLLQSGLVLVEGGGSADSFNSTSTTELFDPSTGQWTSSGQLTMRLVSQTATLLPTGQVLVAGGDTTTTQFIETVAAAELYDPTLGMWAATGSMTNAHDGHTATLLTNGLVLVAGQGESPGVADTAELYNPATATWSVAAAMNMPRKNHTATLLPNGLVLVAGGSGLASAELFSSVIVPRIILANETKVAGGAFQFSWTNTPGSINEVMSTTNLLPSGTNWITLGNGTEVSSGHFQYSDFSTNSATRFYRVRSP